MQENNVTGTDTYQYTIRGCVFKPDGNPVVGLGVNAYRKDFGVESFIAGAFTGKDGVYEIIYSPTTSDEFLSILVKAIDPAGNEISTSGLITDKRSLGQVDLVIRKDYKEPSRYELLKSAKNYLSGGLKLHQLDNDGISLLSSKSGQNSEQLLHLSNSSALAVETGLSDSVFFGLASQGIPTSLSKLSAYSPKFLRKSLEEAQDSNLIPSSSKEELDKVEKKLEDTLVNHLSVSSELSRLIGTVLKKKKQQKDFMKFFIRHEGSLESFLCSSDWKEQPEIKEHSEDLAFTLSLSSVIGAEPKTDMCLTDLELIKSIQTMRKAGDLKELKELAAFKEGDWEKLLKQSKALKKGLTAATGKAPAEVENQTSEAEVLVQKLEKAFPTEFMAYRLIEESNNTGVKTFFTKITQNNYAFDIRTTHIDSFLQNNPDILENMAEEDRVQTVNNLKILNRTRKVTGNYKLTSTLLKDNIDSSLKISRMGQNFFIAKYGKDNPEEAKRVHKRAQQVASAALNLIAEYSTQFNRLSLDSISAAKKLPELENLFGSFELSECPHCNSVLSPASYLVDMLHFLNDRHSTVASHSVKDVLFARRPDISHIELTCENTNTTLPYIDLVNEILENAVKPLVFEINRSHDFDLDNKIITPALCHIFAANGLPLSQEAEIEAKLDRDFDRYYQITCKGWRYIIKSPKSYNASDFMKVSSFPQTGESSSELSVTPEHVNINAFNLLREQYYPWSLPFDLWLEETRGQLENMGSKRYELMQAFLIKALPDHPRSISIWSEYLGLALIEWEALTGTAIDSKNPLINPCPNPWKLWGMEGYASAPDPADSTRTISGDWSKVLAYVRIFMQKASVSYQELTQLLTLRFINPYGFLRIVSTDPDDPTTCDTTKLKIINRYEEQAPTYLDYTRMHSFIRLWRKTGMDIYDLDKAICGLESLEFQAKMRNIMKALEANISSLLSSNPKRVNENSTHLAQNTMVLKNHLHTLLVISEGTVNKLADLKDSVAELLTKAPDMPYESFQNILDETKTHISKLINEKPSAYRSTFIDTLKNNHALLNSFTPYNYNLGLLVRLKNTFDSLQSDIALQLWQLERPDEKLDKLSKLLDSFEAIILEAVESSDLCMDILEQQYNLSQQINQLLGNRQDISLWVSLKQELDAIYNDESYTAPPAKNNRDVAAIYKTAHDASLLMDDTMQTTGFDRKIIYRLAAICKQLNSFDSAKPEIGGLLELTTKMRELQLALKVKSVSYTNCNFVSTLLTSVQNAENSIEFLIKENNLDEEILSQYKAFMDESRIITTAKPKALCLGQAISLASASVMLSKYASALSAVQNSSLYSNISFYADSLKNMLEIQIKNVQVNSGLLLKIAHARKLQADLKQPLVTVLSWFSSIDTYSYTGDFSKKPASLFEKLLQSNKTNKLMAGEKSPFTLGILGMGLVSSGKDLSDAATSSAIMAALGISGLEYALLVYGQKTTGDNPETAIIRPVTNGMDLSLTNLTALYRSTSLAKAMKLGIQNFLHLKQLCTSEPFADCGNSLEPKDTYAALNFVHEVNNYKHSGFTIPELSYLLRNCSEAPKGIEPSIKSVSMFLDDLRAGLQKVVQETTPAIDAPADMVLDALSAVLEKNTAEAAFSMLKCDRAYLDQLLLSFDNNTYEAPLVPVPEEFVLPSLLRYNEASKRLSFTGVMTEEEKEQLLHTFEGIKSKWIHHYKAAIESLFYAPRLQLIENADIYKIPCSKVSLEEFPQKMEIPDSLKHIFFYSEATKELIFAGVMTESEKTQLINLPKDRNTRSCKEYLIAVEALFSAPRRYFKENLRVFKDYVTSAKLVALPEGIIIPDQLKSSFYYDGLEKKLYFQGSMTNAVKDTLLSLPPSKTGKEYTDYAYAVNSLSSPDIRYQFMTDQDICNLFDSPTSSVQRLAATLERLMRMLRKTMSEALVKQKLGEALKLAADTLEELVVNRINSMSGASKNILSDFLGSSFIQKDLRIKSSPEEFPSQFKAYYLLHKISLFIEKLKLSKEELLWIFEYGSKAGLLNLNSLPLELCQTDNNLAKSFRNTLDFFRLRDTLPEGRAFLNAVSESFEVDYITQNELVRNLSSIAGIAREDIYYLIGSTGIGFSHPHSWSNIDFLNQLSRCFEIMKKLGSSAQQCRNWAKSGLTTDDTLTYEDAESCRNAVKAKYSGSEWIDAAKPLADRLREMKRDALAAYLLINPIDNQDWKNANDIYGYFLIDVEMNSSMITSRIKQAISSVQQFIQRCFMNLEGAVSVDPEIDSKWLEWEWMKHYRVWEANRKVFLYPENWIEPDLRDDKSPFFKEFEDEILQNELTDENVETAFKHYLEKLDPASQLEPCGIYVDEEKDLIHVIARTFGTPKIYYYRRLEASSQWTPWERVDIGIESDHLIPLMQNHRLYLFWPSFTEKTVEPKDTSSKVPKKYWEIKLSWSEYKNGKWTPKQTSTASETTIFFNSSGNEISNSTVPLKDYTFTTGTAYRDEKNTAINYIQQPNLSSMGGQFELNRSREGDIRVESQMLFGYTTDFDNKVVFAYTPTRFKLLMPHQYPKALPCNCKGEYMWFIPTPEFVKQLNLNFPNAYFKRVPLFFQDEYRAYFSRAIGEDKKYNFSLFYHPMMNLFTKALNTEGIKGLLTLDNQLKSETTDNFAFSWNRVPGTDNSRLISFFNRTFDINLVNPSIKNVVSGYSIRVEENQYKIDMYYYYSVFRVDISMFNKQTGLYTRHALFVKHENGDLNLYDTAFINYKPDLMVVNPYPVEEVDFSYSGAYSLYNWEIFFHIPLLIADRLSTNQKFEDAMKWFHYIFNPTDASNRPSPQRFWRTRPFFEKSMPDYEKEQIETLLKALSSESDDPEIIAWVNSLNKQVERWRENPFMPHMIARMRSTAYQKTVVMKYLDNIINWGDQLFRQDTMESINEATQLYILAAMILGRRPEVIKPRFRQNIQSYYSIEPKLDSFSNAMVDAENLVPLADDFNGQDAGAYNGYLTLSNAMLYFGIPKNDKLWSYWDTVSDRLYKIRNGLNIEGIARQLALFEPPIDPAMLVKAAAAGLDISSAVSSLSSPLPYYRFNIMVQKAAELCSEVKALGAALLSALEKRDSEELALIRAGHEKKVLLATLDIRAKQVDEALKNTESLEKTRSVTEAKLKYYQDIEYINTWENQSRNLMAASIIAQGVGTALDIAAGILHYVPQANGGASGISSPVVTVEYGGLQLGNASTSWADVSKGIAAVLSATSSLQATTGSYKRRWAEWKLQERLAEKEIEQIDKQLEAAKIRREISEKELNNHQSQIINAEEIEIFMKEKYTNKELYNWMITQISTVYFQSYKLAYDIAKRAEMAYSYELADQGDFIQFGYWDSLKKGLLSGEKLYQDLKRMEVSYLDKNKRNYELTRHISLAHLDPTALLQLKQKSECFVSIPEWFFDMDFPGHYMRRIKAVSLSIPCISGPYTSINCRLTLTTSRIRKTTAVSDGYEMQLDQDDPRFIQNICSIQSIVTSSGQNDSGMFEQNLHDDRYLPFEGAGAISTWKIELDRDCNHFDFNTISDLIIHMKYTAREGGEALKASAKAAFKQMLEDAEASPLAQTFSMRHGFPNEWSRFTYPISGSNPALELNLTSDYFPMQFRRKSIKIFKAQLFLLIADEAIYSRVNSTALSYTNASPTGQNPEDISLNRSPKFGGIPLGELPNYSGIEITPGGGAVLSFMVKESEREKLLNSLDDMGLILYYTIE